MAQRVGEISPPTQVTVHMAWLDAANAAELLRGVDLVVDALDALPARLVLQHTAAVLGAPLVHGAIAGYVGQVMTIYPGDPGLEALYGSRARLPQRGIESRLGNPAATAMMVAAWQVHEVVKVLLGQGAPLRHRLLVLDAEFGEVSEIRLPAPEDSLA